jgi:ABC-type Fe3+ transport system permease subunit
VLWSKQFVAWSLAAVTLLDAISAYYLLGRFPDYVKETSLYINWVRSFSSLEAALLSQLALCFLVIVLVVKFWDRAEVRFLGKACLALKTLALAFNLYTAVVVCSILYGGG